MSQRRTLILAAAIIVGALGAFLVWNYVNGVEDKVNEETELVSVYLVDQPIARGTSGNEAQAYIKKDSLPRKAVPANIITDPQDIHELTAFFSWTAWAGAAAAVPSRRSSDSAPSPAARTTTVSPGSNSNR